MNDPGQGAEIAQTVYSPPNSRTDPRVQPLRQLLRNLVPYRALYETCGISEIAAPDGTVWSLWDVEALYKTAMRHPTGNKAYDSEHPCLPIRQRQAIELFLVLNMQEDEAARQMGLSPSNPVGMYCTSGLTRLLKWIDDDIIVVRFSTRDLLSITE